MKLIKLILRDARVGDIVCHQGRWGVVCQMPFNSVRWATRCVDFWDGGREYVRDTVVVEVVPNKRGVAA